MQDFKMRIEYVVDNYFRGNKKALAEAAKIPYTTLVDYTNGNRKDPSINTVYSIWEACKEVNLLWLAYGIEPRDSEKGKKINLLEEAGHEYNLKGSLVIKCSTDVMQPYICKGDLLSCLITQKTLWGRPYLLIVDGGQQLGKLYEGTKPKHYLLKHDNPDYPPYEIEAATVSAMYLILSVAGNR